MNRQALQRKWNLHTICAFVANLIILTNLSFAEPKHAIYWKAQNIQGNEQAADGVIIRGFSHVVIPKNKPYSNWYNWFNSKNLHVIQALSHWDNPFNLTYKSPFTEEGIEEYLKAMETLNNHLIHYSDSLAGIVDDIEISPFPKKRYTVEGVLIYSPFDSSDEKLGNSGNGGLDGRPNFKDYPEEDYHDVEDLTIENIQYNFPKKQINQTEVINNYGIIGYYAEGYAGNYDKWAQTFRPHASRITRIDIMIKRCGDGDSFPKGHIEYFLTETDAVGNPDLDNILGNPLKIKMRINNNFDYNGTDAGNFDDIEVMSLYFDPDSIGLLDIEKKYALVLDFTGEHNPDEWNSEYYVIGVTKYDDGGPYQEGQSFRGKTNNVWTAYSNTDIWFKIFYPEPPEKEYPLVNQDSESRHMILGYNYDYARGAQTFKANEHRVSSVEVKIRKTSLYVNGNINVSIQETDAEDKPSGSILASYRIMVSDLEGTNYHVCKIPLSCYVIPNQTYAFVFEFQGEYNESAHYQIRSCDGNPYPSGMTWRGNEKEWIESYTKNDLYFKVFTTRFGLSQFYDDWVDFQAYNIQRAVEDYVKIIRAVNHQEKTDLKVYIYSGYQGVLYGGESIKERYSVDWSLLSKAGIDYAICGYGKQNIYETLEALLSGHALLIGGAQQKQDEITNRYEVCNGGVMYWYSGGYQNDDLDIVIPVYKQLPYETGFEDDFETDWDGCWRIRSSNKYGRIKINNPCANILNEARYLTMDVIKNGHFATNEARLYLNLDKKDEIIITFRWKSFDYLNDVENDMLDGIYFSDDAGINFKKVYDLSSLTNNNHDWSCVKLDVDALAFIHGLDLTNTFVIKFQQHDDESIPRDGLAFDDICIFEYDPTGLSNRNETNNHNKLPDAFTLSHNYPNPFDHATTINYALPTQNHVYIKIYNVLGQEVATLVDEVKQAGCYSLEWNGKDMLGQFVGAGIYFYKIETGNFTKSYRMVKF